MSEVENAALTSSLLFSTVLPCLRWLQGPARTSLVWRPAKCERLSANARENDDDGCYHRQNTPDSGDVYFEGRHDLPKLDETEIAESRWRKFRSDRL